MIFRETGEQCIKVLLALPVAVLVVACQNRQDDRHMQPASVAKESPLPAHPSFQAMNTAAPETAPPPGWPPTPLHVAPGSIPRPPITAANPRDGAKMVYIPPGPFFMGDADQDDNPLRTVKLGGFWIYKNDVTVAQYRKFCQGTGRVMPEEPEWGWKDDHPMVNVSWADAKAYCDWAGAALPTEEQWEKAARGTDARKYPWGNKWDPAKLWSSTPVTRTSTAPVGSDAAGASPYGCLDMEGNVRQWCKDWCLNEDDDSQQAPNANPSAPPIAQYGVLKGGSWGNDLEKVFRCSSRYDIFLPTHRDVYIGFRAARGDSS